MLKLHHLRDFVAIAQSQSIRGAGRALGLAQPALTRSLRELEQHLGAQLLERHARGVQLTGDGERFLARARAALEEVRRGTEEVQQLGGNMQGAVTVGLSSAAMLALLPAGFQRFRKECPQVRLRLVEGPFPAVESRMRDGQIDFYVGPRPERLDRQQFQLEIWFGNQRRVVVRRGHPLEGVRRLDELVDADWLLTGLHPRLEQELDELFADHGLPTPRMGSRIDSTLGLLLLLTTTDAMALLPRQMVETPMFSHLLRPLELHEALSAPDIGMIKRAGLPLTPAAELFAAGLRAAAG